MSLNYMEKDAYLGTLLSGLGGAAVGGTAGALGSENALMGGALGALTGAGAGVGARYGGPKVWQKLRGAGQEAAVQAAPKAEQAAAQQASKMTAPGGEFNIQDLVAKAMGQGKAAPKVAPKAAPSVGIPGRSPLQGDIPKGEFRYGLPVAEQQAAMGGAKRVGEGIESSIRKGDDLSAAIQNVKSRAGGPSPIDKANLSGQVRTLRQQGHISPQESEAMLGEIGRIKVPAGVKPQAPTTGGAALAGGQAPLLAGGQPLSKLEKSYQNMVMNSRPYKEYVSALRSGDLSAANVARDKMKPLIAKDRTAFNKIFGTDFTNAEISLIKGETPKLWKGASIDKLAEFFTDNQMMNGILFSLASA